MTKKWLCVLTLGAATCIFAISSTRAEPPANGVRTFAEARSHMVDDFIVGEGITDPRVIRSMRDTPRHEFVTIAQRKNAYYDMGLPIGEGQTISPPFIVAYMTEQLDPQPTDKVLEIGTGSGYQAAVLSPLVKDVYTIEIVKPLGERAARTLKRLKYANVHTKIGDGYEGWPENAPFDKIVVTCSPEQVPPKLVEQLREGGRMVVPVGERYQQTLYLLEKRKGKLVRVALLPTLFVPMTGQAEAGRLVQSDPEHPALVNGGFEETVDPDPAAESNASVQTRNTGEHGESSQRPAQSPRPKGWYFLRQLQLIDDPKAPQGKRYALFTNDNPARASRAIQGFPVDGRKVHELQVSLWVRAKNAQSESTTEPAPALLIVFYDESRIPLMQAAVGPWPGTFGWQLASEKVRVPPRAREAILRVGMDGATGELGVDDVRVAVATGN